MTMIGALNLELGAAAAEVAARVTPSVVQVLVRNHGAGAGTIWRVDGLIVTNHHVSPNDDAEVRLNDGRQFPARAVGRDVANDLCILRIDAQNLPAATIADSRSIRVGELVLAIGHPFGVRDALTFGVVSTVASTTKSNVQQEIIQADVRLGPGNSGGPLVNADGGVIGINSMVAGGLAFAVPSHLVDRLVNGPVERPMLGVRLQSVQVPPSLRNKSTVHEQWSAIVVEVSEGSPADSAGILVGDVILAVDGRAVGGEGVRDALVFAASNTLRVTVLRGGEPLDVFARLDASAPRAA